MARFHMGHKENSMNTIGKTFSVRGSHGIDKTMAVYAEDEGTLMIRMVTKSPYGVLESDETLSRALFESCLRTGFIKEIPQRDLVGNLTVA
jgi:hypothetical protein